MKKILTGTIFAACILLQLHSFGQTILLQEDFSSESLPADWTNDSIGNPAVYMWEFTNPGGRNIPGSNFDTSFVILDSDHYGQGASQISSLTTDTFSAAGFSGLMLELDEQYFTQSDSGSYRKIEASGDQGANWFTVTLDTTPVGYPVAVHNIFSLDSLTGATGVMLRFTFSGTWDFWWAMDNIHVTGFTPCLSAPEAGITISTHDSVCAATQFELSLSGNSVGTGQTYQWQWSADSLTWTDLVDDTLPTALTSQIASSFYRCIVTCSGLYDSSVIVNVAMNPASLCYCIPLSASCSNINYIFSVSVSGTTLNNLSSCQDNDSGYAYSSYPASGNTTAIVHQSSTYDFSVGSTGNNIISLWIDYDKNGAFDPDEWYQVTTSSAGGIPEVVSIQIPDSIAQGLTGMRIRTRAAGNTNGSGDACTAFLSGETEDYYIYIDTLITGIQELAFPDLVIYPNPASSSVKIDFRKAGKSKVTLTLLNIMGSVIREQVVPANHPAELSVEDLAEGMYLLQIRDQSGFAVRKLSVKRF